MGAGTRAPCREGPGGAGPGKAASGKRLHLVTDAGFVRATLVCILVEAAALLCAYSHGPLRFWAEDVYEAIKLKMLGTAHEMAWWSLLGLLSSSCCVLQIILNAFSFGCAGFNTVLGPVRPPLIAFTVVTQSVSWYVALPRPFQWAPTAASTVLSLFLTFSPEMLDLHLRRQLAAGNALPPGRDAAAPSTRAHSIMRISFAPAAMGCISCVNSVRKTLAAHPAVVQCAVSLEKASAEAIIESSQGDTDEATTIARLLVEQVTAGGFPASLSSVHPATSADMARMLGANDAGPAGACKKMAPEKGGGVLVLAQCIIGGLLGSSCCLIQLGANLLASLDVVQIGCTGLNKVLGPIRGQLRIATAAYLSAYWLWALSRAPAKRRLGHLVLVTSVYLVLTFLPELLVWSGGPALAPPTGDAQLVRLQVDGMGCEACQSHVKGLLDRTGGVITSSVDFKTGRADVYVARGWGFFNISELSEKLEYDGYMIELVDADKAPEPAGSQESGAEL